MRLSRYICFLFPAVILAACILTFSGCAPSNPFLGNEISLSQAIDISRAGHISEIAIQPRRQRMTITLVPDGDFEVKDINGNPIWLRDKTVLITNIGDLTIADLHAIGFILPDRYSIKSTPVIIWAIPLAYIFLFITGIGIYYFWIRRPATGSGNIDTSFSRSGAQLFSSDRPGVTFADIAGIDEAKEELWEVVDFLKNTAKFHTIGARIPKGVLLIGPPGTGKTLLARALAGEAGVPFYSISGSEFVEMFVGVGASRVRDLFAKAKQTCPCIVFIDEIDAVGYQRGRGHAGSREEEQTLNQILTEMDGFDPNTCVIVLAATNRPDILDPALLRPGRFDRRITIDLPDRNGRKEILEVHCKGKPIDTSVDLEVLAKETHGFSGADLANLVNEAAILAARREKMSIGIEEMEESLDRVLSGPQRKSRQVSAMDKKITAYHEAGHALVARFLPQADPVHKISIASRGALGGYTRLLPLEDRYIMTRSQCEATLATLLAGHIAEGIAFKEISTGPHNDIKHATSLAYRMVTEFGMSDRLPLRTFSTVDESSLPVSGDSEQKDFSEETARQIDDEVKRFMDNAQKTARTVLVKHSQRLVHLAEKLMIEEMLAGSELEKAFTEQVRNKTNKSTIGPADLK
jgi:cell division protease FtsH